MIFFTWAVTWLAWKPEEWEKKKEKAFDWQAVYNKLVLLSIVDMPQTRQL